MNNTLQRFLVFFFGVPIILGMALFLPQYHHLAFNIFILILSLRGALEFSLLLAHKNLYVSKTEAAVLGSLPSAAMILIISFDCSAIILPAVISVAVAWLVMSRILSHGDALENFIYRLAAGFAVLMYPGALMAWIIGMSRWDENAKFIILTYVCIVFGCDAAAWAVGMLFGKGNQGIIPASPHKSIAGFAGGTIAAILLGGIAAALLPEVFSPKYNSILGIPFVAGSLLGLFTGIAGTLGDLGESAIKRSSGLKDSGKIIMGRGGILDCIDSISVAAPVYYLVFSLLFIQP